MHYNEHGKSSICLPANKVLPEYRCILPVLARDTAKGRAMFYTSSSLAGRHPSPFNHAITRGASFLWTASRPNRSAAFMRLER
jgi:hypothetical protein